MRDMRRSISKLGLNLSKLDLGAVQKLMELKDKIFEESSKCYGKGEGIIMYSWSNVYILISILIFACRIRSYFGVQ